MREKYAQGKNESSEKKFLPRNGTANKEKERDQIVTGLFASS